MKMFAISFLSTLLCATQSSEAYKALVVFPMASKSHGILGEGISRHLLEAGFEVTYMTSFPKAERRHPSLREIDVSSNRTMMPENWMNVEKVMNKEVNDRHGHTKALILFLNQQIAFLENEETQNLFNDPEEHFDVVIVEWIYADLLSGISAVFNCPYIWVSTMDPHWMVLKLIDEVPNTAYVSDIKSRIIAPFTFLERVYELLKATLVYSFQTFYLSTIEKEAFERLLVPIIKRRGHKVPEFNEIKYNASLMLGNTHVSLGQSISLPQSYKAVGGFHIDDDVKPLPETLKTILDSAHKGLIYFSMGSNLRSQHLPSKVKDNLLKMFGKLNQTILWKFEEDLPNRPTNVHIVNWAPQQSILAHSNCILFITHGGLLSIAEAIYFGKPFIGVPVFADQFSNIMRSVQRGYAKRVDLSYAMADELDKAINDMITEPSYSSKARERSFIFHHRPVSPGKELAHWVKHVVLTGGAPHLRSPALMVPWYQKCYLDVIIVIIGILYGLKLIMKKIRRYLKMQEKNKIWNLSKKMMK